MLCPMKCNKAFSRDSAECEEEKCAWFIRKQGDYQDTGVVDESNEMAERQRELIEECALKVIAEK